MANAPTTQRPDLSVVVPAYNEEQRLPTFLNRLDGALDDVPFSFEVLLVNDGSNDRTEQIMRAHTGSTSISLPVNGGKAKAVQEGIRRSRGDFVMVLDADLEYPPEDIPLLMQTARDAGRVVAVHADRFSHPANRAAGIKGRIGVLKGQSLGPWLANKLLALQVRVLYGRWFSDHLTGFRMYPGAFLRSVRLRSKGFEGEHEMTALLLRNDIPIVEVPVAYAPRSKEEGKKIRPIDGLIAVRTFLIMRVVPLGGRQDGA